MNKFTKLLEYLIICLVVGETFHASTTIEGFEMLRYAMVLCGGMSLYAIWLIENNQKETKQ